MANTRGQGSLTTPTCDETVTWRELSTVAHIGHGQLAAIHDLFPGNPYFANGYGNNRAIQPLNGRNVTMYRPPPAISTPDADTIGQKATGAPSGKVTVASTPQPAPCCAQEPCKPAAVRCGSPCCQDGGRCHPAAPKCQQSQQQAHSEDDVIVMRPTDQALQPKQAVHHSDEKPYQHPLRRVTTGCCKQDPCTSNAPKCGSHLPCCPRSDACHPSVPSCSGRPAGVTVMVPNP